MFGLTPWKQKDFSREAAPTGYPLAQLRNEFDALFDRFFSGWPAPAESDSDFGRFWGLEVVGGDKEVVVKAEAPGFEAGGLDVQVSGQLLTIEAEKKQESKKKKGKGQVEVQSSRTFRRTVTLPPGIKSDGIEAHYRNGVLEVRIPRSEEGLGKRIPVKA